MFTSRAEYRLTLRADNADQRLTPKGEIFGCVSTERTRLFHVKQSALEEGRAHLRTLTLTPKEAVNRGLSLNQDGRRRSAFDLLGYAKISMAELTDAMPEVASVSPPILEQLRIEASYAGYLSRQTADIDAFKRDEGLHLPTDVNYADIGGLSGEIVEKLSAVRPTTLGQASRIAGMTPAALTALLSVARRADEKAATG